ncbi:MAG: peptidase M10 [Ferruginibacter sp.]
MGEASLDKERMLLIITAEVICYGDEASEALSIMIASDIERYWNEPNASIRVQGKWYKVQFLVTGLYAPGLIETELYQNTDPRKNYFRIEKFAYGNISFVDGINSNTGYFKLDNLLDNSTTAAHEFGHTIGLEHPEILDIRGGGIPGIMYPRGTIVDAIFQYDPAALPLQPGGTLNPFKRKVLFSDIEDLRLDKLDFNESGIAILGAFTSVWHDAHQL